MLQDLIAFWTTHGETIAQYVGVIVPWVVETNVRVLGILLSWPAVALYLGVSFILMFRGPITTFLTKINYGKVGPVEFGMQAGSQPKIEAKIEEINPSAPKPEKILAAVATGATASSAMDALRANVAELSKTVAEAIKVLFFERALNVIWGSQLRFLVDLKNIEKGMLLSEYLVYYSEHVKAFPNQGFANWHGWLKWLIDCEFVTQDDPSSPAKITEKGREFVEYVEKRYGVGKLVRVG